MANIYGPSINFSYYHCKTCPFFNMNKRNGRRCYCEYNNYYVDPNSYCHQTGR